MEERERRKIIDQTLVQLEKQFGKGSIVRLGSSNVVPVSVISTGSISIDSALGVGGVPAGAGDRSLRAGIVGQDHAGSAGDRRGAAERRKRLPSSMPSTRSIRNTRASWVWTWIICWCRSRTTASRRSRLPAALIASGAIDVVVVDSVAALVPRAELEGEMGDSHMGLHARLMSQALRKLTATVSRTNTCLVFINQIREKIGVMFGNPETTTGGRALKFYSSVRLDIRRIAAIKDGDTVIGNRTRVKVVKNKVASPFREAEFDILYGQGISREGDLLDLGVTRNLIEKSGSWFSYKGERIGQGRDSARQFLKENPEVRGKIDSELRSMLGLLATGENGSAQAAIASVPQK